MNRPADGSCHLRAVGVDGAAAATDGGGGGAPAAAAAAAAAVPVGPPRPPGYVSDGPLSSIPDVTHRKLQPRDQFLLLACDGVWDVYSDEQAVKIVSEGLQKNGGSAFAAGEHLVDSVRLRALCVREGAFGGHVVRVAAAHRPPIACDASPPAPRPLRLAPCASPPAPRPHRPWRVALWTERRSLAIATASASRRC